MNGNQERIIKRMKRMSGMSSDHVAAMHAANEKEVWWVRCWNCKQQTSAVRTELKICSHCGKNLWSRE